MSSVTRRLAEALGRMTKDNACVPSPELTESLAALGFAAFCPAVPRFFHGQHKDLILLETSNTPLTTDRAEQISRAIKSAAPVSPLVIGKGAAVGGAECREPHELILDSIPWPTATEFPQETALPGDMDLVQFQSHHELRKCSLELEDGRNVVRDADAVMREWLEGHISRRLVLRGIRGAGKTWQLIHFAGLAWKSFRDLRGEFIPVIYVSLGKPEVARIVRAGRPSGHPGLGLLEAQYGKRALPWDGAFLASLIDTGGVALALDGLDEVYKQATPEQVRALSLSLATQFTDGAKLLVAGRSMFVRLLPGRPEAWRVSSAQAAWLYLDLLAVEVRAADPQDRDPIQAVHLEALAPVQAAALGHPALRADLLGLARLGPVGAGELRGAVLRTFVEFNLRHERTRERFVRRVGGSVVRADFSEADRIGFLAELAWYMSERALRTISIDRLPRRLARQFGIDNDAMKMDARSQLVLEQRLSGDSVGREELSFALPLSSAETAPTVEQTLTGAMFVSEFLADRLGEGLACPKLGLAYFLRFLGRVPLTDASAFFLRERIATLGRDDSGELLVRIKRIAQEQIVALARAGGGRVFVACLRYLVSNLRQLGAIVGEGEERALEPWTTEIASLVGSHQMAIVPAARSPRLDALSASRRSQLRQSFSGTGTLASRNQPREVDADGTEPFLLGVHEVTNAEYEKFIWSREGVEWRVRRITRAGSAGRVPESPFASATNEYHLYFWTEGADESGYHPAPGILDYPVTYVSWNAAAAYCDWLSAREGRLREYGFLPDKRAIAAPGGSVRSGFRLPALKEWLWAAYGGSSPQESPAEVEFPWDWVTPGVSEQELPATLHRRKSAMKATQLESGKHVSPVLEDELVDFGVSGLVGNVKEWIDDAEVSEEAPLTSRHVIAGATAYLGLDSFRFGYYVSLFSENTNPDVGFRVARTLESHELDAIRSRERQLRRCE